MLTTNAFFQLTLLAHGLTITDNWNDPLRNGGRRRRTLGELDGA